MRYEVSGMVGHSHEFRSASVIGDSVLPIFEIRLD